MIKRFCEKCSKEIGTEKYYVVSVNTFEDIEICEECFKKIFVGIPFRNKGLRFNFHFSENGLPPLQELNDNNKQLCLVEEYFKSHPNEKSCMISCSCPKCRVRM